MEVLTDLLVDDDDNSSFVIQDRLKPEERETRIAKDAAEGFST